MDFCMQCGRELTGDEIGLHKRIINRGDTSYWCIGCLAKRFGCEESLLREKSALRILPCPAATRRWRSLSAPLQETKGVFK